MFRAIIMIDPQLLSILRCPVTASTLSIAEDSVIQSINEGIGKKKIQSRIMEELDTPIDGGLINQEGSLLMPIYQGIPDMNPDDAITLGQLQERGS
ncbi:MAG: Trm112 family protein [Pirellulaceae bacterium]